MKSQTSIVAKQVRLQKWAEQIKDCQARPKGTKVEDWCDLHGISKANYYYRLRCVREACLEQIQHHPTEFVELSLPQHTTRIPKVTIQEPIEAKSVAILHGPNNITIELLSSATPDFLHAIIGVLHHVG